MAVWRITIVMVGRFVLTDGVNVLLAGFLWQLTQSVARQEVSLTHSLIHAIMILKYLIYHTNSGMMLNKFYKLTFRCFSSFPTKTRSKSVYLQPKISIFTKYIIYKELSCFCFSFAWSEVGFKLWWDWRAEILWLWSCVSLLWGLWPLCMRQM
jgi:hypothetical protein